MPEERDRVTVGVTPDGAANLDALMQSGWFTDEVDAYRTAIATAIGCSLDVSDVTLSGVQTKYNVGTLDRDGRLISLVRGLASDAPSRTYEYCERLADAGLRYLRARIVDQGAMLSEVLNPPSVEAAKANAEGASSGAAD